VIVAGIVIVRTVAGDIPVEATVELILAAVEEEEVAEEEEGIGMVVEEVVAVVVDMAEGAVETEVIDHPPLAQEAGKHGVDKKVTMDYCYIIH
jgi:23S rRNA U2552 (ribose-2'-O)-methylase RlmE/FtsJ